jgi:predicted RNase H-like HicB family nuclease
MSQKDIQERAAQYEMVVEWSEEDQCFVGRCPELMFGGVHGSDKGKVYAELCVVVEEMIELVFEDEVPPSREQNLP